MLSAFRIVKAKRSAEAFTGEGARRSGGRWNSPGTRVVYAAGAASLAAIEMLVHLDSAALLSSYVYFEVQFDEASASRLEVDSLPANWRSNPAPSRLQSIGYEWAASVESVVLRVPSAVLPIESNYLINPLHPDFHTLQFSEPTPFEFDQRLNR